MPSTPSTSFRLELIANGEQAGLWGTTTNINLGTLLEQAIVGSTNITMADADYTLTAYNYTVDEARSMVINAIGTNAAIRDIIAPLVKKIYVVRNNTTGGFAINIRGTTGGSVQILNNTVQMVASDGAGFYSISPPSNAIVTGMIALWYGSIASIPLGWLLCDGTNGTPNLQGRFVLGALPGTYNIGATGGNTDAVVVSHTHGASSGSSSVSTSSISLATGGASNNHTHAYNAPSGNSAQAGTGAFGSSTPTNSAGPSLDHTHIVSGTVSTSTSTTTSTTIAAAGVSGAGANIPPYYALCYIMHS